MKNKKNSPRQRRGLTLIELITGIAIFSIVILIVFGAFSMAIKAQKRAISLQNIQENAKFILDFITKETRMSVINNISDGIASSLSMTRSADGDDVIYAFDNGNFTRNGVAINSGSVNVTGNFYILGSVDGDGTQTRVTIAMKLKGTGIGTEEDIEISTQATLCQRLLDF